MALIETVSVLDYLRFEGLDDMGIIGPDNLNLSVEFRTLLNQIKQFGISLEYDGSKSQRINILSKQGNALGHVHVFGNLSWKEELLKDFETLVDSPEHYGLK